MAAAAPSGLLPALAWTLGVPLVLVLGIVGFARLGERYQALVADVPEELHPFPKFSRRSRGLLVASLYAGQAVTPFFPAALPGLVLLMALCLGGRAGWNLASGRATGRAGRLYVAGWMGLALLMALFAVGLYRLNLHASQRPG